MTETEILSDERLKEIEAHFHLTTDGNAVFVLSRAPALCQTVRALREQLAKSDRVIKSYNDQEWKSNTALREQLAESERVVKMASSYERDARQKIEDLESQLAQVEKERDDAREMVTMMTTEKQRAEQDATSQCVEKVREMRDRFQEAADSSSLPNDLTASRDATVANALTRLLGDLESLPLEPVEQEKQRC